MERAGLDNSLVLLGGGQWVVQAPVMLGAAQNLGVPLPKTALDVA